MKYFFCGVALIFSFPIISSSQTPKKTYPAVRITTPPHVDGMLNDACWQGTGTAADFIQYEPNPGQPARQKTLVRIVYDHSAVYVGAFMHDTQPDSIVKILTPRDEDNDFADWFGIAFDTYRDGQNAVGFFVTAAGVQTDMKFLGEGDDVSWNAVWECSVKTNDSGWAAEFAIPFSAIRFPGEVEQSWGMGLARSIRRYREMSTWNPVNPNLEGIVKQFGILENISDITPPLRLTIYPYLSVYLKNAGGNNTYSYNGGADLKYGISESFTLDATLIPDFGQARSDDIILNLSPFEVQYQEQRQFFTEGTELFDKDDLFYSRRIGGIPLLYEDVEYLKKSSEMVIDNPPSAQLYNATKLSGRTKHKLGIGLLNATTAPSFALLADTAGYTRKFETQSLANYNVLVFDQALPNNSFLSLINTNVIHNGQMYDANVTGTGFRVLNEKNSYAVDGSWNVSQKYFNSSTELGQDLNFGVSKVSGNFTANLNGFITDDRYDPNDLGYLQNNNETEIKTTLHYNIYEPFWKVVKMSNNTFIKYSRLYFPSAFSDLLISIWSNATFTNYLTSGFWVDFSPVKEFDFYEPRTAGRYYVNPAWLTVGSFFSSDYRKAFALDGTLNYGVTDNEKKRYYFNYSFGPRLRLNTKLLLVYNFSEDFSRDNVGFAAFNSDTIVFGKRDLTTFTNRLEASYIFSRTMSLSFRMRHYWSTAAYKSFHNLEMDGTLTPSSYLANKDISFTKFNIDLVFTWQFSPGSEMSIVWKNTIGNVKDDATGSLAGNLEETFLTPPVNSLSVKALYYIDYNRIFGR